MADKKYEVGITMTFDKVLEDGTAVPGMIASIKYLNLDYADAVQAESCILPTIEALFQAGKDKAEQKQV